MSAQSTLNTNITLFANFRALQIIDVSFHHLQLLCFEHNKHVLVEKPMALNHRDAKQMVDAARL